MQSQQESLLNVDEGPEDSVQVLQPAPCSFAVEREHLAEVALLQSATACSSPPWSTNLAALACGSKAIVRIETTSDATPSRGCSIPAINAHVLWLVVAGSQRRVTVGGPVWRLLAAVALLGAYGVLCAFAFGLWPTIAWLIPLGVVAVGCMVRLKVAGAGVVGVPPRDPSRSAVDCVPSEQHRGGEVVVLRNGTVVHLRHCRSCKMIRPPRTSHCGICDVCVARFDHHCVVLGVCVGRDNIACFIGLLLAVGVLACVSLAVAVSGELAPLSLVVLVIATFSAPPVVCAFLLYVWLYLIRGMTLWEFQRRQVLYEWSTGRVKMPFDQGCAQNTVTLVCEDC